MEKLKNEQVAIATNLSSYALSCCKFQVLCLKVVVAFTGTRLSLLSKIFALTKNALSDEGAGVAERQAAPQSDRVRCTTHYRLDAETQNDSAISLRIDTRRDLHCFESRTKRKGNGPGKAKRVFELGDDKQRL